MCCLNRQCWPIQCYLFAHIAVKLKNLSNQGGIYRRSSGWYTGSTRWKESYLLVWPYTWNGRDTQRTQWRSAEVCAKQIAARRCRKQFTYIVVQAVAARVSVDPPRLALPRSVHPFCIVFVLRLIYSVVTAPCMPPKKRVRADQATAGVRYEAVQHTTSSIVCWDQEKRTTETSDKNDVCKQTKSEY